MESFIENCKTTYGIKISNLTVGLNPDKLKELHENQIIPEMNKRIIVLR